MQNQYCCKLLYRFEYHSMYTVHKVYLALAMLVLTIMSGGTSVTLESLRGKYNETAPLENCARAGTETMKEATRLMVEVRYSSSWVCYRVYGRNCHA